MLHNVTTKYQEQVNLFVLVNSFCVGNGLNPLAPELFFFISAHPVYKM